MTKQEKMARQPIRIEFFTGRKKLSRMRKSSEAITFIQKLVEGINKCYGEPFLPDGFVKARLTDYGTLWLDIGDRNGEFDKSGKRIGSGINVGDGIKWRLEKQ